MTEHRHPIVTSVTDAVESSAAEDFAAYEQRKAAMLERARKSIEGYHRRLLSPTAADQRWAEDERRKAEMADRRARRSVKTGPAKRISSRRSDFPLEREEQAQLVRWLRANRIDYNANLEGVNRHFRARLAARHAGMRRGRPDIEVISPVPGRPDVRGIAVELKRQKGARPVVSDWQLERLEQYRQAGWLAEVHYGAPSAIRWLAGLYGVRS